MNRIRGRLAGLALFAMALLGCAEESGKSASQSSAQTPAASGQTVALDIYKSPTCGCCGKWVDHAEERGFEFKVHHPENLNQIKAQYGISYAHQSCHTAVSAEGYVFEGHVPARYIHAFLSAPPADALGLSVPAMPVGSPGMEVEGRFMTYDVLLLKRDGTSDVFAKVTHPEMQYE